MAQKIAETAGRMLEGLDMEGILRIAGEAGPLPAPRAAAAHSHQSPAGRGAGRLVQLLLRWRTSVGCGMRAWSWRSSVRRPAGRHAKRGTGCISAAGFPRCAPPCWRGNAAVSGAIRRAVHDGMPAYAECGGLMYLARGLVQGGRTYRMAGVFDMDTEMAGRLTLNYTRGVTDRSPVSRRRAGFRGHEFHYSRAADIPGDAVFAQRLDVGRGISGGRDGIVSHNAMASYGHLYLSDAAARALADGCARYSRR